MKFRNNFFKKRVKFSEIFLRMIVYLAASMTCLALISIVLYIFINGIGKINFKFLVNSYSESQNGPKGILPMIINTFYIVLITMLISTPIGMGTAIYTTQYSESKILNKCVSFSSDILSGVPSVIFGIFGYSVFCSYLKLGTSIIAGCITMAICILPTIIRTSEEALKNVPNDYKEAAFGLGASKLRTILTVVLPSAMPEIVNAMSLCVGKILGESAILLYTVGMSYSMPKGLISHIFKSGRTLTLHLYQVAKQSTSDDSLSTALATSLVLVVFILILNLITNVISNLIFPKK